MPERVAERDRAAVDVDALRVEAELADDGDGLRRERLVELDEVDVADGHARRARAACAPPGPGRCPSRAGRRRPPRSRRTRRAAPTPSSRARSSLATTRAAAPSLSPLELPAVTLPPERKAGFSVASFSAVVCGRGCSSRVDVADGHELVGEAPGLVGRRPALLRAQRERVLLLARDAPALGDVLARLAHRLEREQRLHGRVAEAPAERRVVGRAVAAGVRLLGLRHARAARGSSTRRRRPRRGRPRRRRRRGTPRRRRSGPTRTGG